MALTKLMQWLLVLAALTGVWATLVANAAQSKNILHRYESIVLALPILLVGLFAVYAVIVVLYRVFTFNNCEAAAEELNKQIEQARQDLKGRGFLF